MSANIDSAPSRDGVIKRNDVMTPDGYIVLTDDERRRCSERVLQCLSNSRWCSEENNIRLTCTESEALHFVNTVRCYELYNMYDWTWDESEWNEKRGLCILQIKSYHLCPSELSTRTPQYEQWRADALAKRAIASIDNDIDREQPLQQKANLNNVSHSNVRKRIKPVVQSVSQVRSVAQPNHIVTSTTSER